MNVLFSPSVAEQFIIRSHNDADFTALRSLARVHGVPSLEEAACGAVANIVSIKRPRKSIDIGCGIGVSSLAILKGYPETELTALDGNLERLLIFNEYFKDRKNVVSYQMRGEQWLCAGQDTYDFAFIDSVKREYGDLWRILRKKLNKNAVVIFDDILLYGYILCEDAEVPYKYKRNRVELLNFLEEIFADRSLSAQIIPVSGGLLVISMQN